MERDLNVYKIDHLITFMLFVILLLLVFLHLFGFKLWPQVEALWGSSFDLKMILTHPHGPRYLLVYPIFIVSEILSVDYNFIFSLVVVVILYFTSKNIFLSFVGFCEIKKRKLLVNETVVFFTISCFIVLISCFMNGRITFAIYASSIILWLSVFHFKMRFIRVMLLLPFCLFLSSVSSGTIIVITIWIFFFITINSFFTRHSFFNHYLIIFIISLIGFSYVLSYFVIIISKNINYFGGGVEGAVNMLVHGYAKVFFSYDVYTLVLLLAIGLCTLVLILLFYSNSARARELSYYYILVSVSIVGGASGLSTMMTGIPVLIFLILFTTLSSKVIEQKSIKCIQN